jgi:hypothetical protein
MLIKSRLVDLLFYLKKIAGYRWHVVWGEGRNYWDNGIVGSNPSRGTDICSRVSVFSCSTQMETLRRVDNSSREFYQMSKQSM